MSEPRRQRGSGVGWLVLLAMPPLIVVVGLTLFLAWQVREGKVSPKWKPKPPATNQVQDAARR